MIRSLRSLIAPAFAVLALGLATGAQADYSVSLSVALGTSTPAGVTIAANMITASGATLTFSNPANQTVTGVNPFLANNSVTAGGTFNGTTVTFSIVETISIANNGSTGSLTQNVTYMVNAAGFIVQGASTFDGGTATQATTIGGTSFVVSNPTAGSAPFGQGGAAGNNGVVSALITPAAVPEPASVVMLGLGLVGTLGFAARRRLA